MQEQEFTAANKINNEIDTSLPAMEPDYEDYPVFEQAKPEAGFKISYDEAKKITQRKVAAAKEEWKIKQRAEMRRRKAQWLGFFGIFSHRR